MVLFTKGQDHILSVACASLYLTYWHVLDQGLWGLEG